MLKEAQTGSPGASGDRFKHCEPVGYNSVMYNAVIDWLHCMEAWDWFAYYSILPIIFLENCEL